MNGGCYFAANILKKYAALVKHSHSVWLFERHKHISVSIPDTEHVLDLQLVQMNGRCYFAANILKKYAALDKHSHFSLTLRKD